MFELTLVMLGIQTLQLVVTAALLLKGE